MEIIQTNSYYNNSQISGTDNIPKSEVTQSKPKEKIKEKFDLEAELEKDRIEEEKKNFELQKKKIKNKLNHRPDDLSIFEYDKDEMKFNEKLIKAKKLKKKINLDNGSWECPKCKNINISYECAKCKYLAYQIITNSKDDINLFSNFQKNISEQPTSEKICPKCSKRYKARCTCNDIEENKRTYKKLKTDKKMRIQNKKEELNFEDWRCSFCNKLNNISTDFCINCLRNK